MIYKCVCHNPSSSHSLSIQLSVHLSHPCEAGLVGAAEAMMEVDQSIVLFYILVESHFEVPAPRVCVCVGACEYECLCVCVCVCV